jgi:hypothetical protein
MRRAGPGWSRSRLPVPQLTGREYHVQALAEGQVGLYTVDVAVKGKAHRGVNHSRNNTPPSAGSVPSTLSLASSTLTDAQVYRSLLAMPPIRTLTVWQALEPDGGRLVKHRVIAWKHSKSVRVLEM